jgi:hypothetical protein
MGVMEQPVEKRGDRCGITKKLPPIVDGSIRGEKGRRALISPHDQLEEIFGSGVGELAHAEIVDLCGAPHKSTNATPAVMWSRRKPEPTTSLPIRFRTSH